MFKDLKQLFQPKNKDLRHRIYFTLAVLTIFVIGTAVEVPGTQGITKNLGFLELLNVMSGGSLRNFSIFALGVSPYISASIIVQLLQMDIIPYFSDLAKQGHAGQQKLNQITRYLGIFFGFIQGYAMSFYFLGSQNGILANMKVALILTAGTAFLMWLADQVTQKGIGNGMSLIIMAGIVISLPNMMITAFNTLVSFGTTKAVAVGIASFLLFLLVYLIVVVGIISFGLNSGAYVSQIIRSGLISIPKGQEEASTMLGFNYFQTMKYVIMPQALRNVLPALGNEFITLLKETSVAGYIGILELTKASDIVASSTYDYFFPLLIVAIIYLILTLGLTKLLNFFERRLSK